MRFRPGRGDRGGPSWCSRTIRKARFEEKFLRRDELYGVAFQIEEEGKGALSATAALKVAQQRPGAKIIPDQEFNDEFAAILQGYYDFKKRQIKTPPK